MVRFGALAYEDPMSDLKNLVQQGNVQDYVNEFDHLLNRVALSRELALSCTLGGLKDKIQLPMRMFGPKTLQNAYLLAKLQEATVNAL